MKVNFQKIFIVFSAVCVISCFAVPISAADNSYEIQMELKRQFELDYLNLVGDYENGYITYEEFQAQAEEITQRYNEVNTDENGVLNNIAQNTVNTVNKITDGIGNAIGTVGESVKDWIADVFNGNESTETVPSTDMQGFGCKVVKYLSTGEVAVYLGDYAVVRNDSQAQYIAIYSNDGSNSCVYRLYSSSAFDNVAYEERSSSYAISFNLEAKLYGDIRNFDGTQAPTNDEYMEQPTYNFDNATDSELDELLNELFEELERQNPDLSSIEGLLESIYYRLGTLDKDNDNELLSQVLVAIQSLENTDNSELLSVLNEIKEELTNGTTGDNLDLAVKLENMITVDDFAIDEEAYKNHSEVLKLRLQEKFVFADDLKNLVVYTFNKYANSSENSQLELQYNSNTYTVDLNVYNEYMPTIRFMIAAFTYISFALHTYRKIPSYINGGDNL